MYRIFRHYIPKTLLMLGFAEALILLVSIYLGVSLKLADDTAAFAAIINNHGVGIIFATGVVFAVIMLGTMSAMGLYQRDLRDGPRGVLLRLVLSFALGLVCMAAVVRLFPALGLGNGTYALAVVCAFVGIASCRFLCFQNTDQRLSRRVAVLGAGEKAQRILGLRRRADRSGVNIIGCVSCGRSPVRIPEERVLGQAERLGEIMEAHDIDELVVALDDRRNSVPADAIMDVKMRGIHILEDTAYLERQLGRITLESLNPSNVFFSEGFSQAVMRAGSKRVFDVLVSAAMLLAASPLMLLTVLAIRLESGTGAPIFYRQERVGVRGLPFQVIKFRSMRVDAEKDGVAQYAQTNDSRITRVGAFIRKTRIDELPQLFNVLRGDMSFVGPRPERPQFVAEYTEEIPFYNLRHYIKPGITGWAQVCYPYGASTEDARKKLEYDLYYLKNYSVFLDLNILMHTVGVVLWGKGSR